MPSNPAPSNAAPTNTGLDNIIRQVEGKRAPHKPPEETIISILLNPERSFLTPRRLAHLLVRNYRGSDCRATVLHTVDDFSHGWRLDLKVEYRVRVAEGTFQSAARKIAEQLCDRDISPTEKLERILAEWLHHCENQAGGPHAFILDFYQQRQVAAESIRRSALEHLGLDVHVGITLKSEGVIKDTEEIPAFTTKVVFKDYDRPVDLKVEMLHLDLHTDPHRSILAHVRSSETGKIREALERRLREIAKQDLHLQDLRGHATRTKTKQDIKDKLNATAAEFGRTIRVLDVTCETPLFQTPEFYQSPADTFPVSVPDYPQKATVTADMQLELADLGRFASAGVSSLDAWAKETLRAAITPRVSRHPYVRLAQVWDDEKNHIDRELQQRAESIGFKWIHSNVSTSLPFDKVRRPFRVHVNESVTTSNSESKVTIDIEADVKITNVSILAERYPTEIDLEGRVAEAFRLVLHSVGKKYSPKAWYLSFDVAPDNRSSSLKTELQESLARTLESSFGGKLLAITITRDGKLLVALNELRENTPHFDVFVTRQGVKTDFAYRVLDVREDMWARFEATKPTIDALNERIRLHIQQMFADEDPAVFHRLTNRQVMDRLNRGQEEGGVPWMIANQYGLSIYIDHWVRDVAAIEKQSDNLREAAETLIFDDRQRAFNAHTTEEKLDLEWKQQMKQDLRDKIRVLHPVDDAAEIATLESRLRDIDRDIQSKSTDMLKAILIESGAAAEAVLSASLGQTPGRLLGSGSPEESKAEKNRGAGGA